MRDDEISGICFLKKRLLEILRRRLLIMTWEKGKNGGFKTINCKSFMFFAVNLIRSKGCL